MKVHLLVIDPQNDFCVGAEKISIPEYPPNASTATRRMIAQTMADCKSSETLESLVSILAGVNASQGNLKQYLDDFQREAGFQQYVAPEDAAQNTLGKLGGFISRSISSQSQALGTGEPSQSLTF